MKKASKGFSLVELIVVIAIMSIVMSLSLSCLSMVRKATVNSASYNLVTQIERVKTEATTRHEENIYLKIYSDAKSINTCMVTVNSDGTTSEKYKISLGSQVELSFVTEISSGSMKPGNNMAYLIGFDRRSGAVNMFKAVSDSGLINMDLLGTGAKNIKFDISLTTGTSKHKKVVVNIANGTVIS